MIQKKTSCKKQTFVFDKSIKFYKEKFKYNTTDLNSIAQDDVLTSSCAIKPLDTRFSGVLYFNDYNSGDVPTHTLITFYNPVLFEQYHSCEYDNRYFKIISSSIVEENKMYIKMIIMEIGLVK